MAFSTAQTPTSKLEELLDGSRIEELSSEAEPAEDVPRSQADGEEQQQQQGEDEDGSSSSSECDGNNVHGWMPSKLHRTRVPALFAQHAVLKDLLVTETSEKQEKVVQACLDIITGDAQEMDDLNAHGLPRLQKQKHIKFLKHVLGNYPPPFQAMDASRPWLVYWALAGLSSLGVDVSVYRERTIRTFTPLQNATGGFGGGHGHYSHCAATYAAVLSLAIVDGLDMVDRRSMWQWLGSVKQPDGSFTMAIGGEKDVRGAYCSMTVHTLLNLPQELPPDSPARQSGLTTFTSQLGEWLSLCQTYEGGIASAPANEAHGAYAFCCLACLCLLDAPHISIPKHLNTPLLLSWLSARQLAPEGSFTGRTNKLVDACYSHWVGGCWALLEAALSPPHPANKNNNNSNSNHRRPVSLWSREGLVRYTLSCSQTKKGGLRDKPGTRPDGYHTCYSLAGLSAAQNHYYYSDPSATFSPSSPSSSPPPSSSPSQGHQIQDVGRLTAAFNWHAEKPTDEERRKCGFEEADEVGFVHPVFVIPFEAVERTRRAF